jgi:hypothetical protein
MISSGLRRTGRRILLAVTATTLAALLVTGLAQPARAQPGAGNSDDGSTTWTDVDDGLVSTAAEGQTSLPLQYRLLALDMISLQAVLAQAPARGGEPAAFAAAAAPVQLALPMPQGGFQHFAVEVSPVMAPALAAQFPDIQTYRGRGIDEPTATVRLGLSAGGFHAVVLSAADTVYITHLGAAGSPLYVSYLASDYPKNATFACDVRDDEHAVGDAAAGAAASLRDELAGLRTVLAAGPDLRSYRLAVAATGEYSAVAIANAGLVNSTDSEKVAAVMGTIVTRVNMVNAIYEREVSIHFDLVADNAKLVYLNPDTDPYTNNRMDLMLGQNRDNLDAVIGSTNYDAGHALGTAGGGIAYIGVACSTYKGGGVSGAGPADNPYTVMVTAHELGHQFGAYHTFNANSGACGGGNRSAANAYEPGSGSTIMSYSGLCGAEQNLPGYFSTFHVTSFGQIYDYSRNRNGSTCGTATPTGNQAPVVDAGPDYTIPARTPFVLSGTASDPDGQPLTYSWQQVDVLSAPYTGTATLQQAMTDLGSGALYRIYEFAPGGASRSFPALANVLSGTVALGEVNPTTNRTLNFRLFARDNQVIGGGANYDSVRLTVLDTGSAFSVAAPAVGTAWPAGLLRFVQWNAANTSAAPIACSLVDILLSSDGGATFSTVLAATANDGSELVPAPAAPTEHARVLVRCAGNIFYNVSSEFVVQPNTGSGTLSGIVRGIGGEPVAGAQVAVSGPDSVAFPTDAAGQYSIQLPTGSYTLTVSAYGYADSSESSVSIANGAANTRNLTLTALPLRTISGRVTDAGHGYPLYASLEFTKALAPVWTNPLTGYYTVTLIEGYTYTVSANAWTPGFAPYVQVFEPLADTAELNIALEAEPTTCQAPGYGAGTGQCLPVGGGLLVGSTYGPNGGPLVGVGVGSESFATYSAATADPGVPDAFYNLFLPLGTQVVTATSSGLPAIPAVVAIADKSVLQQDFDWHAVYTDASLKQLSTSSGTLAPQFSSAVLGYDTEVTADVSSVDLLFAPGQPGAAVSVNGIPQDTDTTTATVELRTGTNRVTIVIVALDGVTTQRYTIRIVRVPWPDYLYLPNVRR